MSQPRDRNSNKSKDNNMLLQFKEKFWKSSEKNLKIILELQENLKEKFLEPGKIQEQFLKNSRALKKLEKKSEETPQQQKISS